MSFVLGIYDLAGYLIPGFLYLFVINDYLRLFKLRHLIIADFTSGFIWIGLAVIAFLLGFLSLSILDRLWFKKHWPGSEEGLERVKQRHPELEIGFKPEDWTLLYTILKQRIGSNSSLEHAERFNAFCMMSRNLVGAFVLGSVLQISKLIINGFDIFQLILAVLLALVAYATYINYIYYWNVCMERAFSHFLAYGNNMGNYLANDQPKWNPQGKYPEK